MKMRRTLTAASAALIMTAVSIPALAFELECDGDDAATVALKLQDLAVELRCSLPDTDPDYDADNPGTWPLDNPIWEKRGTEVYGCQVHRSLAAKLHENRSFTGGDECDPPRKNCKDRPPENENNQVRGASGDVANGKYDGAISKLSSLQNDAQKARINSEFDPGPDSAHMLMMQLVDAAEDAKICIAGFLP